MPITITTVVSGSLVSPTGTYPNAVKNGDFTITGNPGAVAIGEGVDEETRWTFDFNADPAYSFFDTAQGLTSAILTLTLTPRDSLITTDLVRIDLAGFGNITGPIQVLPVNVTNTIHIDLLEQPTYTASAILNALAAGAGKIPMVYGDDSIVSGAKLELTQQSMAYQYVVKFVCGKSEGKILAAGTYFTAINVHNPSYKVVRLRKKFAVGLPSEKQGPITKFFKSRLGPDGALEIDTEDILRHIGTDQPFVKGFAVIECDSELDVVAVYTAGGRDGQVVSIHTERVHPRKACCCTQPPPSGQPDLIPVPGPNGNFQHRRQRLGGHGEESRRRTGGAIHHAGDLLERLDGGYPHSRPRRWRAGYAARRSIPPNCFQPDCSFRIIVDATNVVAESNEANNTASGTCIG